MSTDTTASGRPPSETSTTRLVLTIMDKRPKLGELLRTVAVPLWFDVELLTALRNRDDGRDRQILARLDEFSFLHTRHGRYWFSPEMRRLLLMQWGADSEGLREANRRALGYFEQQLAEAPPQDPAAYEELVQARLFHLLAWNEEAGLALLDQLLRMAEDEQRLAVAQQYVHVADEQRPFLSPGAQMHLDYARGRVMQIAEDWAGSQACFEEVLGNEARPADLVPRVERALARSLVAQCRWADYRLEDEAGAALREGSITKYEKALAAFETRGDRLEAGRTMAGLGHAYLSLALNLWGTGWLHQARPRARLRFLYDLGNLLVRLPLVIYLMWQLGFRKMLPVAHRLGYNLDWIVARLLGTAAQWLRQAERRLSAASLAAEPGCLAALIRVEEDQAHLYRLLNHPRRAEEINFRILDQLQQWPEHAGAVGGAGRARTSGEGAVTEGYRAARALLGIAHAQLLRGEAGQAKPILDQILPVFRRYGHRSRIAQTQMLLAQADLLLGRPDDAVLEYEAALESWREVGNLAAMTDIVHEMEALLYRSDLPLETRQAITESSQQLTERHYPVRYSHPILTTFQKVSLIALVFVFFFSLRLAIHTESGSGIGATATLIKPIHRQLPTAEELSPALVLTIEQQLRPETETRVVALAIAAAFVGYLLVYTALGLYLIHRTPLDKIETGRLQQVALDAEGIEGPDLEEGQRRLAWEEVTEFLLSDRGLRQRPLTPLSFFALFAEAGGVMVSAFTRHYVALRQRVQDLLGEGVRVYDRGFRVFHSKSGWLFLLSLAYLLLFVLLSKVNSEVLTAYVDSFPYNLSALYGLAYLGVAFPLVWWFGIQPLRAHFLISPRTPTVWWVGGVGLVLAIFYLVEVSFLHLPLGRPDVALGVVSIVLVAVAARHVLLARQRHADGREEPVYTAEQRSLVLVVAGLAILTAAVSLLWELVSFHYLAQGNLYWWQAEQLREGRRQQEAVPLYERALLAYEDSLQLREEPAIYNSRGSVYAQLDRYPDAIRSYELAFEKDPDQWAYLSNVALAYTSWVSQTENAQLRIGRYNRAIVKYDEAVAGIEASGGLFNDQMITVRLLRAAAYYDLGQIYEDQVRPRNLEKALENYQKAMDDYQWVVDDDPGRAAGHTGLGWTSFKLRLTSDDIKAQQSTLRDALGEFTVATNRDEEDLSAYIGKGWVNYYLALTYDRCKTGQDPEGAKYYRQYLVDAIQAYDLLVEKQGEAAIHYRVRAQLKYLLRYCPSGDKDDDLVTQLERTLDDYDLALDHDPSRAEWYFRRAHLYYALAYEYRKEDNAQYGAGDPKASERFKASFQSALADFEKAAELEPNVSERWFKLSEVTYEWKDYARSLEAAERAVALEPKNPEAHLRVGYAYWRLGDQAQAVAAFARAGELNPDSTTAFWRLGWSAYLLGAYQRSVEASARAIALNPAEPVVYFNQGLAYLALGDLESAWDSYLGGAEAAEELKGSTRKGKYNTGIDDLEGVPADLAGEAGGLIRLLEAMRDGELQPPVCLAVYANGLFLRSGPGLDYRPPLALVTPGALLTPAARSEDGAWLQVTVEATGEEGWVTAGTPFVVCQAGVDKLPVMGEP